MGLINSRPRRYKSKRSQDIQLQDGKYNLASPAHEVVYEKLHVREVSLANPETTAEDGSTLKCVENEFTDESMPCEVTLESRRHDGDDDDDDDEEEGEVSHEVLDVDSGCEAVKRDLPISEKIIMQCEYEPYPHVDKYRDQRCTSCKAKYLVMTGMPRNVNTTHYNATASQPFQSQEVAVSEPPCPQIVPPHLHQPQQVPFLHSSKSPPVEPNHRLFDHHLDYNPVHYRIGLGNDLKVPGMTVSVPSHIDSGSSHVELQWNSNPDAFPVLSVDQRPLTNVLHCLPHGPTVTSPVFIELEIPVNDGKIEVFYSPTDVAQTPVWTKLRAVIDACTGNTRLTDGHQPLENQVMMLKNGRTAVLVLRHFCSFVVVENGNVVSPKKAEVAIFLKTKILGNINGQASWLAIFKVVLGCDNDNMLRRYTSLKKESYKMIEKTELLLYKTESGSRVEVGIRDVEWMVGSMQKQSRTRMAHSLDCLWSGLEAMSQFWMESKGSKQNDEQLAFTVFVRQDGRLEKQISVYCDMTSPFPSIYQQHVSVTGSMISQRCDTRAKVFPTCESLDVAVPTTVPPSSSSDCSFVSKDLVDLHSSSSEPEVKATVPVENLHRQKKTIETEETVKLLHTADGIC